MLHDKQRVRADFSRAATVYDAHAAMQKSVAEEVWRRASALIPEHAFVLDAGAGTGFVAEYGVARSHWRMVLLDIAEGMNRLAHAKLGEAAWLLTADVEQLPLREACVNGVVSSLAFQWINDPAGTLKGLVRVIKPGGALALSTFGPRTLEQLKQVFGEIGEADRVNDFFALESLIAWAQEAGFIDVSGEARPITRHYTTTAELFRELKTLGAGSKRDRPGLSTQKLALAEKRYRECFGGDEGLPVTWEALYITARKS